MTETRIDDFYIRFAEEKDVPLILKYIKDLADYEDELDHVTATEEILKQSLFVQKAAQAILGIYKGVPVGFGLFFKSFSTYTGKSGFHLIDLYIEPEKRGNGFGKAMLSYLADLTAEQGFARLEWWVHDWNEPAIGRYKKWGAFPITNLRTYRMCENNLQDFADFYKRES